MLHTNAFTWHRSEQDAKFTTVVDDDSYSCSVGRSPYSDYMELPKINQMLTAGFNEIFEPHFNSYLAKYSVLGTCPGLIIPHIKVQRTKPGQGYHAWHCEDLALDISNRVLAFTLYLNDNFEAGETEFLYQNLRVTPKMGDLSIFPASFTHTHRGNPPINGVKYIITGWVEIK